MVDVVGGDGTVLRRKPWLTFSLLSSPASRYGLDFTHLSANRINAKDRQRKRIVRMSQWHAVDASVETEIRCAMRAIDWHWQIRSRRCVVLPPALET